MEIRSEMVEVAAPGGRMPAQVAHPVAAGRFPGVIVVQEAFGLNGHIKEVARRLAAEGYVTLAPDLFYRGGAGRTAGYGELPKAIGMMSALKDGETVEDVAAAVARLERETAVRADALGITGFCMGGRVSYLAACALPEKFKAAVPFYGGGIPVERTDGLACPVLALFGEDDSYIPLTQVVHLRAEASRLGKRVDVVVYPKAGHGFFCDERDSYRPEAAADAWRRLLAFFAQHLA
jgi:carboxymethylenebutenolidase